MVVDLGRMNRRNLLRAGAGTALAAYGLAGCTVERPIDKSGAAQVIVPKVDGDLLIFNWAQYMDPALQSGFEDKYGVSVTEANFDSMEAMLTKLRSGAQFDLTFPTSEYVMRLRQEGLLHEFDRHLLSNAKGIDPYFDDPWYDPGSRYSVPYAMYTTGICWRSDIVTGMTGSWNDITNPTAEGRAFMLDDFQEAIGQANLLNGFDLNTEDPSQLAVSKQTLLDQKGSLRGYSTNTIQTLTSGLAVLQQAWNGDIVNVRNQVDDPDIFKFETCKEGIPVGSDTMAVPVNARSPGTALLFINWILQPEHAAQNVAWTGYPQPVEGAKQEFTKLVKAEPSIDITLQTLKNGDEYRFATPEGRQEWNQIWTEVKAS
ncbi:MAG: polyamine ABC transporter substrate-binding protein [Solirubrobacterales bacterium]